MMPGFHTRRAADLAKIMKYCIKESLKSDEFLEITRTAQYSFSDAEGKCTYQCTNHNAFLQMMEGALSGKRDLPEPPDTAMSERCSGRTKR